MTPCRLRATAPLAASTLLFLATPLVAQPAAERDPRVEWLAKSATRIRSLDPSDGDFSDLEPLRAALKGARVVMLGEQSHGDGTTFLAKTRLIRFLHEQMGFNVLAFESGLYDRGGAGRVHDRADARLPARGSFGSLSR